MVIEWREWPEGEAAVQWDTSLVRFAEINVYQAYGWGEYKRRHGWRVVRGEVALDGIPVAMVQCLAREIRFARLAFLWIPGGPAGGESAWRCLAPALRTRYRGWSVCIRCNFARLGSSDGESVLGRSGWSPARVRVGHPVTFVLDLAPDADSRRASLRGNWRHNLKRGEERGVRSEVWPHSSPVEPLHAVYLEMSRTKNIPPEITLEDLRALREAFGPSLVLAAARGREGEVLGVRGFVRIGENARDIVAAVSGKGRKVYASYPLAWDLLEQARSRGVRLYDLGGADAARAPGVYNFKKGLGGREVEMVGEWEWTRNPVLRWGLNRAAAHRRGAREEVPF